jgi:FkbM family methyltransferase
MRRLNLALFQLGGRGLGLLNPRSRAFSGEQAFIRQALRGTAAPIVFDVGANEGHWSAFALSANPGARIFAFEPHPRTYERLASRLPGARCFAVGVGERAGVRTLHDYADGAGSGHASFVEGVIETVHRREAALWQVVVATLDDLAAAEGVDRIDLLKVDVEGMELAVLRGAQRLLERGAVKRILFEFNEMNLLSGARFADFYALLAPRYRLYRVLPHGRLAIDRYHPWMHEQFVFQNFVAELRPDAA